MTSADAVERHLVSCLGAPSLITSARDAERSLSASFRVATFDDQPAESAFTLTTLGVSEHEFRDRESRVRQELLVCAWNAFRGDALHQFLFAMGNYVIESRTAAARGMIYEFPEPFTAGRAWQHVFVFTPLYHSALLSAVPPVDFMWLIPITPAEFAFIQTNGPQAFDDLLTQKDPDLLDLGREAVV